MNKKRFVVMAKSSKKDNYCIAGLELETKKWIRPVSTDSNIEEAIPQQSAFYYNGESIQIFDVVEVQAIEKPVNNLIQPENFYYDENVPWKKIGHAELSQIINWRGFDERQEIFYNTDRVISLQSSSESLLWLLVKNLVVNIKIYERKKIYVNFDFNGKKYYRFGVGDIDLRNKFLNCPAGEHFLANEAIVIFSLTNPFERDGKCYKMAAQIFFLK